MKMRTFTFTPDAAGRTDFLVAYESFRGLDPEKITKDERPYLTAAQRALESVSEPIGKLPEDSDDLTIDVRKRKLKADGAVITISQKLHEKINDWVENTKFQAVMSMAVSDFSDRWGQAEKKDDDAPGPVGVAKKKDR